MRTWLYAPMGISDTFACARKRSVCACPAWLSSVLATVFMAELFTPPMHRPSISQSGVRSARSGSRVKYTSGMARIGRSAAPRSQQESAGLSASGTKSRD